MMRDQIGELAYLITGNIAATCCHKGGAFKADNPRCECRAIAEGLIEDKDKVVEILNGTYEPRKVVLRASEGREPQTYPDAVHPSHKTRFSEASSFDEVCTVCGAKDVAGSGWGSLRSPCKAPSRSQVGTKSENNS